MMDPYTDELLRAAADGDVHFFASHGKVIGIDSCRDESGNSALLLATRHGHKGLVELFIHQYDANVNAKNGDNETPLSYAAENGHRDLVNILLQFTNKISTKSYEQAVAKAAENGRMDIVELLLDNGNIDSAAKDHYASEAIASAARGGHISLLQRLFSTYEIDLSSKKTGGYLALLSAAQAGHIGVVKLLTGRNDIEMSASDANGDTALHLAAWDGQTDAVKLLLEKDETKVNARNASGRTALSVALGQGHTDVVELLLERDDVELGGNTLSIDDSIRKATTNEYIGLTDFQVANKCPGRSLLSWTAENGQIEALSILLARDHTGVNSTDGDGRTPLSRAAEKGHKLAAKMLLKYNADANAKDGDSQTPLSRVAAHGHEKVVEMLLQHNADPNSTDRDGRAPLWWAVKNGHAACAEHLIPVDTSTLLLLMHENTQTALEFLLRFKPRLDQRDHQGRTALHLAAEWGDLDIARAVILQGGKLDSKDNRNITPLQIAMREGHIKITQELLKQKVCTKGIMTKEWRDAYSKQKQDIFLLSETPDGQQYPDFPQKFPTWQELSQTSTKCKSRL
ncbi:ankyrin repeat-containing domain protein [Trichoderma sp. SZMC 28012]